MMPTSQMIPASCSLDILDGVGPASLTPNCIASAHRPDPSSHLPATRAESGPVQSSLLASYSQGRFPQDALGIGHPPCRAADPIGAAGRDESGKLLQVGAAALKRILGPVAYGQWDLGCRDCPLRSPRHARGYARNSHHNNRGLHDGPRHNPELP
jgi:hypothetical protein